MKKVYIMLQVVILIAMLTGCTNISNDSNTKLPEKVDEEVKYLDTELISLLNSLNNITYNNYKIVTEEVENNSANNTSEKNTESKNGETTSNSKQTGESLKNNNSSEAEEKSRETETTSKESKIESNNILSIDEDNINWSEIENDISTLTTSWITIAIDLRKIGVSDDKINKFGSTLNKTTISLKQKEKITSMGNLENLYINLYEIVNEYSENSYKRQIVEIKKEIIIAYSNVTQNNWDKTISSIQKANEILKKLYNDSNLENNQTNIYRCNYIMEDILNIIELRDKDLFYLKYRNVMQELNIL